MSESTFSTLLAPRWRTDLTRFAARSLMLHVAFALSKTSWGLPGASWPSRLDDADGFGGVVLGWGGKAANGQHCHQAQTHHGCKSKFHLGFKVIHYSFEFKHLLQFMGCVFNVI